MLYYIYVAYVKRVSGGVREHSAQQHCHTIDVTIILSTHLLQMPFCMSVYLCAEDPKRACEKSDV